MTRLRTLVLSRLRESGEPISAQALARALEAACDQVTVYRTLRYLEEQNLAESFVLHCAEHGTERYWAALDGGAHRHWFHCEQCHRFTDMGACALRDQVAAWEREHGFRIRHHTLYATGVCAGCGGAGKH